MAEPMMTINEQDGATVVEFPPQTNLDARHVDRIRDELFQLVENGQGLKVLLDFENVEFMASQALGFLVTLRVKAARTGSSVVLAAVRETLAGVIAITQIDKLYEIHPTRADAIAAIVAG